MRRRRWLEPALGSLGERIGLSIGQTYTVMTGVVVAIGLLGLGLPPVLEAAGRIAPSVGVGPSASPDGSAPASAMAEAPVPFTRVPTPGSFGFAPVSPLPRSGPESPSVRPTTTTTTTTSIVADVAVGATMRFAAVPAPGAPGGVAVGADGTVYVATGNALTRGGDGPGAVLAFDPTGQLLRKWWIEGMAATRAVGLTDLAVDAHGAVWVLDASTARVLRIDPGASAPVVVATVPDLPSCALGLAPPPCEPGLSNGAPELRGLALGRAGGVYVADRVQGLIWSVDRAGRTVPLVAVADRLPGEGPVDVTVLGDGSLVATISARSGSTPSGLPAVLRFPAEGGGFGAPVVVIDLKPEDAPQAVVATASGRLYVALSGSNEVLELGLAQGDQVRHGAGLNPAFDVPVGLALRDGSLLVTNQAAAGADASRWLVLALGVADRPPPLSARSPE